MTFLFKILQFFLLPSTFILVLILIGLIFLSKQRRTGKILVIIGLLLYYIFSITPVTDLILLPLESQYQPVQKNEFDKADKIVLLLGGKESDVLRASEVLRIYVQSSKFKVQSSKIIVSGKDPLNPERNEAEGVKEFLVGWGIPPENIILENQSRNTFESAKNIKKLVGTAPFFLVTSAYHMPRAMETFQKMGTNPISAPTDFKTKKTLHQNEFGTRFSYNLLDFFPGLGNLKNPNLVFHEYLGILLYKTLRYD